MKGDFSRNSFDPLKHYSRVLQQQGRVELDADANERQAILLHSIRSLAADLIGPHGGPASGGFVLNDSYLDANNTSKHFIKNFAIGKGHYYVDGWLCENDNDVAFTSGDAKLPAQPWLPSPAPALEINASYMVYLDAWERHVSALQADDPARANDPVALREVALNGPDTCSRAQLIWQVKTIRLSTDVDATKPKFVQDWWDKFFQASLTPSRPRGFLQVKASQTLPSEGAKPCVVSPQSGYRGLENQLYRVEVHRGGTLADKPTFVWSRENGCVEFPVAQVNSSNKTIVLADGWRDASLSLAVGDIVELCVDAQQLGGQPGPLLRLTGIDLDKSQLTYEAASAPASAAEASTTAPPRLQTVLRRWDHGLQKVNGDGYPDLADDMALLIEEGSWFTLEDGIAIQFNKGAQDNRYETGDYWLIPARTALGNVLWPKVADPGVAPHGVTHHCAPLGAITVAATGEVTLGSTLSKRFKSLVDLS
ncbi:MAG: hypothetical protein EKK47_07490 [Burkholderiales bacterium]|nr:MAG: hypothetical protein EKK47_07490 [Burkholderiales bacterium]